MFLARDYRPVAIAHEEVFRNILRDLKQNSRERAGGTIIPLDLNTEAPLEEIYDTYSVGDRMGKFTIKHCTIEDGRAWFAFEVISGSSEKGAQLHYKIVGTDVRYTGPAVIPFGFEDED